MNKTSLKHLTTSFAALVMTVSAHAVGFTNTFDAGPLDPFYTQDCAWSPGPIGWAGAGAMRHTGTNGGWNLGGTGIKIIFNETEKTAIRAAIATGQAHVSFDVLIDGTSFNDNETFYQIQVAANSAAGNWKQHDKITGDAWQNGAPTWPKNTDLRVTHFDTNAAAMGWTDATGVWFELYLGANSAQTSPVNFWIDNLAVSDGGSVVASQILITASSRSGGAMNISGTGSPDGAAWRCLSTTVAPAPMVNWTEVGSGTLSGGTFSLSVPVSEDTARYYRMVTP